MFVRGVEWSGRMLTWRRRWSVVGQLDHLSSPSTQRCTAPPCVFPRDSQSRLTQPVRGAMVSQSARRRYIWPWLATRPRTHTSPSPSSHHIRSPTVYVCHGRPPESRRSVVHMQGGQSPGTLREIPWHFTGLFAAFQLLTSRLLTSWTFIVSANRLHTNVSAYSTEMFKMI